MVEAKTYCDWKEIQCPHIKSNTVCSECSKGPARNPNWEDRTFRGWGDTSRRKVRVAS